MILEAKNINKTYENGENTLCVLDELNLTVDKSEIITIMGESGSGKSTLLNILGTLDHPDKGEVYIQGKNVTTLPEIELAELRIDEIVILDLYSSFIIYYRNSLRMRIY